MSLVRSIIVKTLGDLWEEAFPLILFNMFWVAGSVPGLALLGYGAAGPFLSLIVLGLIALLPWPFVTFGLFFAAHEVVEEKVVSLKTFFQGGRQMWRQAYLWGGLNVLVMAILLSNITFYNSPASPIGNTAIGPVVSALFAGITLSWLVWQEFVLAIYPRLETPALWPALRNAGILVLTQPAPVLCVAILSVALGFLALKAPPLGLLSNFSIMAVLTSRATLEMLNKEKAQRKRSRK
jgi:uncharacterized membrane protein YesL